VHVAYKVFPLKNPTPIFPEQNCTWTPILNINVMYKHARSNRFEAVVDSGSPWCLFHADIGRHIGIKITDGIEEALGGVIGGAVGKMYFHKVKLCFMSGMTEIMAGFSEHLSVAGILGRSGFFNDYKITFDPSNTPPGMDLERFYRAYGPGNGHSANCCGTFGRMRTGAKVEGR